MRAAFNSSSFIMPPFIMPLPFPREDPIGGIGFGVVVIILLTFLIIRKGRGGEDLASDSYANAAFDQQMGGMMGADAGISPEQLQYEQQLLAAGYTPGKFISRRNHKISKSNETWSKC